MPLRIHVGLSKKMGLPNYGSLGVSCHLECDVDASIAQPDAEPLHEQLRRAYLVCCRAVREEIARQRASSLEAAPTQVAVSLAQDPTAPDPTARSEADSLQNSRRASQKQLMYARRLSERIPGLGSQHMATLAQERFGRHLSELSWAEASQLIDSLKAIQAGDLDLNSFLSGAAA